MSDRVVFLLIVPTRPIVKLPNRPSLERGMTGPGRTPRFLTRRVDTSDIPIIIPDPDYRLYDNYLKYLLKASTPEKSLP